MAYQSLQDVEAESVEEKNEDGHPFDVFPQCLEKGRVADSLAVPGVADWIGDVEDDQDGQHDVPGWEITDGQLGIVQTDKNVIGNGQWEGETHGEVGAEICEQTQLAGSGDSGGEDVL